jgi:L-aspartate oxidase
MIDYTDYILVGSGIAGLRAAIELAPHGRVTVLTKSRADESNTEYAQGGIAVAMSDEDEIGLHYQDTIQAGDGLCNELAVSALVERGPLRIQELIDWGTQFDREGVRLAFTREAAHSRRRVLHAHGDATGREINRTLLRKVRSLESVELQPHAFALRLLVGERGCEGVSYLAESTGEEREIRGRAVLLATGGIGATYRETTNPDIATGDGYALAFRAGAALADMEFVQFHPTALRLPGAPRFLISEALRGEGGRLRNAAGEAFMEGYHPMADLAPRDVVSRAIFAEADRAGGQEIYLDLTHLPEGFVARRFPKIYGTCMGFGLDISRRPIPVFPAAHYMMGGILTDLGGRTTLPGLFAAGEVACNGVHGANRLASNSLLEGLVFGAEAGTAMLEPSSSFSVSDVALLDDAGWRWSAGSASLCAAEIRSAMSDQVGIVRSRAGIEQALDRFSRMPLPEGGGRRTREGANILINATLIASTALRREESRGAHFRTDFPARDDVSWRRRLVACYDESRRTIRFSLLDITGPGH